MSLPRLLLALAATATLAACAAQPAAVDATERPASVAFAAGPAAGPATNTPAPPTATVGAADNVSAASATPGPPALSGTPRLLPTQPAEPIPPDRCADSTGTVVSIRVPSATLRYEIDTRLYLPPCYAASARRYPALYLIHGLGFTEDQWERLGVTAAADELIASGEIAPLIIVMPRDRRDPRLDPALLNDLVPYVDATYRTIPDQPARAVGGLSRGGGWAVHFGLKYPEVFGRIGLHSPAVFYEDENAILEWARRLKGRPRPAIYIDAGENDATLRSPVWLDQVFTWFELGHTFVVQPGGHSEKYWSQHVRDYLKFYAADWRHLQVDDPAPDRTPGGIQ